MANLKPYMDAAVARDAKVQSIMAEIDVAFNLGTPEGQEQALALRPSLDAAKADAKSANELYVSMRDASLVGDNAAANFTGVADPADDHQTGDQKKKTIKRSDFEALTPRSQMDFVRARGMILENEVK